MRLNCSDGGVINGNFTSHKTKATSLEEALELTGDGVFKYLVIVLSGINLMAGAAVSLVMAYVLPAADCQMKLSSNEKGKLTSIMFTGMIFSSHLLGFLCDTYGRRYVLVRCNIISTMLCILASFAPTSTILLIVWFATGFVVAGTLTPSYVLVSEFCAFKHRTKSLLISSAICALAGTYLPCLAWLIIPLKIDVPLFGDLHYSSWRLYLAVTTVPLIIATLAFMFVPESPKYLLSRGYKDETLQVLRKMYAMNTNKKAEEYPVKEVCLDACDAWNDMTNSGSTGFCRTMLNQTCLLFKPPLLSYMVVSCATNFGLIGAYNILLLWLPEMVSKMSQYEDYNIAASSTSPTLCVVLENFEQVVPPTIQLDLMNGTDGSLYRTMDYNTGDLKCEEASIDEDVFFVNIVIGILLFVSFGLVSKITDLTGRKLIIVLFIMLATASCVFVNFVSIIYTSTFLGSIVVFVGAVLPIAISIIVDFFPTHVRTMATCICMIFGRVGTSAGTQLFGLLQTSYCETSYYGLAAFLFGTILAYVVCKEWESGILGSSRRSSIPLRRGVGILCLMIPLQK